MIIICVFAVGYLLHGRWVKTASDNIRDNAANIAISENTLSKETVIESTNAEREVYGLHALTENELLNKIAEGRARDLLEKQYFDHVSPTGQQASDMAQQVGYPYKIIAENLAQGFS